MAGASALLVTVIIIILTKTPTVALPLSIDASAESSTSTNTSAASQTSTDGAVSQQRQKRIELQPSLRAFFSSCTTAVREDLRQCTRKANTYTEKLSCAETFIRLFPACFFRPWNDQVHDWRDQSLCQPDCYRRYADCLEYGEKRGELATCLSGRRKCLAGCRKQVPAAEVQVVRDDSGKAFYKSSAVEKRQALIQEDAPDVEKRQAFSQADTSTVEKRQAFRQADACSCEGSFDKCWRMVENFDEYFLCCASKSSCEATCDQLNE